MLQITHVIQKMTEGLALVSVPVRIIIPYKGDSQLWWSFYILEPQRTTAVKIENPDWPMEIDL